MDAVRAGIVHEHQIILRGIAGCLDADPRVSVVFAVTQGASAEDADVVVASVRAARDGNFECPVVVCADASEVVPANNGVVAVLPWPSMTPQQLLASVQAAAAGFRVALERSANDAAGPLDPRGIEVLRLLAQGATTRTISETLYYSERTVKTLIHDLECQLSAATRAQAVAEALRRGLI